MSENQFWNLVEKAKGPGGDAEHAARLAAQLTKLSPKEILEFQVLLEKFHSNADAGIVWAAGTLINKGHGTDSGFSFFRYWLIGQGESTYKQALQNPDFLADAAVMSQESAPSFGEWESYGFAAFEAYEVSTGRVLYDDLPQTSGENPFLSRFNWQDFEDEFMQVELPRLWKKYGSEKQKSDKAMADEIASYVGLSSINIDGLGIISVGDYLTHSKKGPGRIEFIHDINHASPGSVRIRFDDDEYPHNMSITKNFIHLWKLGK